VPSTVLVPLHIATFDPALLPGRGLTVTVAVIAVPTQKVGAGPVGVMVKVTVTGDAVVFVSVAAVILPVPVDAMPVTPDVLSLVQAKVVLLTPLLVPKVMVVNEVPVQTD